MPPLPDSVAVGEAVSISAVVTDGYGRPVPGASVTFPVKGKCSGGAAGYCPLAGVPGAGTATADSTGTAETSLTPKQPGPGEVVIVADGAEAEREMTVLPAGDSSPPEAAKIRVTAAP